MLRFSIRDLLWLTVVVALALAWWVDNFSHRHCRYWQNAAMDLAGTLEKKGYHVEFDESEETYLLVMEPSMPNHPP